MDPMSALTNLMDLMLVFACGLIIALIARYNVNLSVTSDMGPDVQRLDAELEYAEQGIVNGDASFAELGMVYQDLETGDLYVVTQGEPDADE
jgi:hypothetical protein